MKNRLLSIFALLLCQLGLLAQTGMGDGGFDPSNPPNPDAPGSIYQLKLASSPSYAATFYRYNTTGVTWINDSIAKVNGGSTVYLEAYNRSSGYIFDYWMAGDSVVSTRNWFYYTMPESDATLTAVYHYDPTNPENPYASYHVFLKSEPENVGSFNWNTVTSVAPGQDYSVYAYDRDNYKFVEWQQDGKTVGTERRYYFTMSEQDITLVAIYEYNPSNPSNPNKNYWDPEMGEIIVDDFNPGDLSSAIYEKVNGASDLVQMITVAGQTQYWDWSVANEFPNCNYLDLSRTTGIDFVPSWIYNGNSTLQSIVLPASVTRIEDYAFCNCSNLSSISCHALTPPEIYWEAFYGIGDSVVYVPAQSIALYQQAEGWKDFTILPLSSNVNSMAVNLPEGINLSAYKDMFIEILNTKSGQKQRYVITDRPTYTFNGLIHRTNYNVYLKNQRGDVLGEIDNVAITDHDVDVTFENLITPLDVVLTVLTPAGEDVTEQTTVTWMDADNIFLAKGNTLSGQIEGVTAKFRIQLPQTLAMEYLIPQDSLYEVQSANNISFTLVPIPQMTIGGEVRNVKTNDPISGATVALTQMLNGLYSKAYTTRTNAQGKWEQTVAVTKTDITVSATDYLSKSITIDTLTATVPTFELKDIHGTTIMLSMTYTNDKGETTENYTGYEDIIFTVFDETAGKAIEEMNIQYPQIVLTDEHASGTVLAVTATSKSQNFLPVTVKATVDEVDRAAVTLPIVQLGGFTASYAQADNENIVGILYDAEGLLVRKYDYAANVLSVKELTDGEYTLVTMAGSQFFNSIYSLSQFAQSGLRVGTDYVKNVITVKSGTVAEVKNSVIPFLDETKLYYTGDNTSFTANKSQVTAGQYLTLRAQVDFKQAYAAGVSDVKITVDLPTNCSFVANSVMTGKTVSPYTVETGKLTVPLADYNETVKFCVIPTEAGNFMPCANVLFKFGGKEISQPIGWAYCDVQSMSITVPEKTSTPTVTVRGTSLPNAQVKVYDNDVFVGETKSLANGNWMLPCELDDAYTCTYHSFRAEIKANDVVFYTESKTTYYNRVNIEPLKITMLNYYNVVELDLKKPSAQLIGYTFNPSESDFTFKVDMSKEKSIDLLERVDVKVTCSDGSVAMIPAVYDTQKDTWFATKQFNTSNLPIAVSARLKVKENTTADVDAALIDKYVEGSADVDLAAIYGSEDAGDAAPDYAVSVETLESSETGGNFSLVRKFTCTSNNGDGDFTLMNSFKSEDITEEAFKAEEDNYFRIADTEGNIYYVKSIRTATEVGAVCVDLKNQKQVTILFYDYAPQTMHDGRLRSTVGDVAAAVGVVSGVAGLVVSAPAWGTALAAVGLVAGVVGAYDAYRDINTVSGYFDAYGDCLREKGLYDSYRKRFNRATGADVTGNVLGVATAKNGLLVAATKAPAAIGRAFGVAGLVFAVPAYLGGATVSSVGDDILSNCGNKDNKPENPQLKPYIDPSGYVYEAVSTNRVEGVTATVYYKEEVEDMYGDLHENIVQWDAEEYAQENPLFTDENGMYQWDVPEGLWQVKFEKEGYQTTYSEWLPVPPPQLDVNIPITQLLQPSVVKAKAYADGVEFAFDKYMDPATLTDYNIMVTKNGEAVNGTIELLDEEVSYEGEEQTYASKVRFKVAEGEELLATDAIQLTVRKAVESYAGIMMENDYTQEFDVELAVRSIVADSLINVVYGGQRTLTIGTDPGKAAMGKKLVVKPLSDIIASTNAEVLTLDENGEAELIVTGELPGTTVLTFEMKDVDAEGNLIDTDVKGRMIVSVKDEADLVVAKPRASRISGAEVYRGTKITLSSETKNSVIWYTLDGSTPSESSLKYSADEPIVIASDEVTIKAIAKGVDLQDSEVAEFTYKLKKNKVDYQLNGWTWFSINVEDAQPVSEFSENAERILSQTQELVRDSKFGLVGNLTEVLPGVGYKVKTSQATSKLLQGYAFNARENAVAVEAGWNWIGYTGDQVMTIDEALAFYSPNEGDYIVGQDGYAEYADGKWNGNLEGIVPGKGYLFKSAEKNEIVFNTTIVSTANSRIGKRDLLMNSPWAYNKRAYSSLMPLTAQLYEQGTPVADGEYLVGAFCGSECRGIGLWNNGRVMLSVYGETGDELRFVAYNPETEDVYNINETMALKADNTGSWNAPYKFTLGQQTTGIKQLYNELTVTPVVARDHITVSAGGRSINRLTLTDMGGRTMLTLNDLGTGATVTTTSLPEGMYIVTVQAEGQTFYKKIVKAGR